jgi:hypothetical protein
MTASLMNSGSEHKYELDVRRKAARKTAIGLAILAFLIFAAFLYSGISGRG